MLIAVLKSFKRKCNPRDGFLTAFLLLWQKTDRQAMVIKNEVTRAFFIKENLNDRKNNR
jgi:hypothetical protein